MFKIGDRVICIKEWDNNESIINQKGTVKRAGGNGYTWILVHFDKDIDGHGEGGAVEGHAFNVHPSCLKKIVKNNKPYGITRFWSDHNV